MSTSGEIRRHERDREGKALQEAQEALEKARKALEEASRSAEEQERRRRDE
jgi:hypothetical protein